MADGPLRSFLGGELIMATILYPTRGGENAYRNQDWAITLAQERSADLLLLFVSNVRFLDRFARPVPVQLVQEELVSMGEFLLALAQERAEKAGIQARTICLSGSFPQALKDVAEQQEVTTVVFGRPAQDTAITSAEYLSELAQSLTAELGVETFVIDQGEIVEHHLPPKGKRGEERAREP
jgi:nucleotide-binding universal stress UspA family protein